MMKRLHSNRPLLLPLDRLRGLRGTAFAVFLEVLYGFEKPSQCPVLLVK